VQSYSHPYLLVEILFPGLVLEKVRLSVLAMQVTGI
jgi:hypothetical protein